MKIPDSLMVTLVVLLIVLNVVFYMRGNIANSQLKNSALVYEDTISMINKLDYNKLFPSCRGLNPSRSDKIKTCLEFVNNNIANEDMFSLDEFKNPNIKTNTSGYIIVNYEKGAEKLDSEKFKLLFNHELVYEGCTTQGLIEKGYSCRLEFSDNCEAGDNLEIKYEDSRVYLKNC